METVYTTLIHQDTRLEIIIEQLEIFQYTNTRLIVELTAETIIHIEI